VNKYRADIDGLRAVAVLIVLFYHVGFPLFSGGFIGVDIFFTISGFLITSIVLKDVSNGNFSFKAFYIRRAARLLPAYILLLIVVTIVGWFLMAPTAYEDFIKSALSSVFFVSNLYFFIFHSGYFSTSVHELPLLHTWSLAVEEQFYLIMPIAILIWFKIKNDKIKLYCGFIFIVLSIFISYLLTDLNQSAGYFLVVSRAHEFLIGSMLSAVIILKKESIIPKTIAANIIFVLSIGIIILTSLFLSSKSNFPGVLALLPCIATVGIIYSGLNKESYSHKVLGTKYLVFIGLLSYSLYLWHWPIISFLKYMGIEFTSLVQVVVILSSIILAYLSWRYVEKAARYAPWAKSGTVALSLYGIPAVLAISFLLIIQTGSFDDRVATKITKIEQIIMSQPEEGREECHNDRLSLDAECRLGSEKVFAKKGILWGDSHANHFTGFIDVLGEEINIDFKDMTMGNCPPIVGLYINAPHARKDCIQKNNRIFEYIESEKPDVVYLAGAWEGYIRGNSLGGKTTEDKRTLLFSKLKDTINTLTDLDINVVVFDMLPRPTTDMSRCEFKKVAFPQFNKTRICEFELSENQKLSSDALDEMISSLDNDVELLSLKSLLCQGGFCKSDLDGIPIYRDSNHLNSVGSKTLAKYFLNQDLAQISNKLMNQ